MTIMPMPGRNPEDIASILANAPMMEARHSPFVWGQGGARMTPEQLAIERARAADMMQSDYSPVGHWTQGLGRVADNVLGAISMRDVRKQDQAAATASQEALAGLNLPPEIAAGISSGDPVTQKVAMAMLEAHMPKHAKPLEFQQMLVDAGFQPGTPEYQAEARRLLQARNDPFITASLPDGGFYGGPQSGFMTALTGGGGQAVSPVAGTASPSPANIPNGSPLSPAPSAPQRPAGMSDADLLKQAEEAVRNGADPYKVMDRLNGWGVRP